MHRGMGPPPRATERLLHPSNSMCERPGPRLCHGLDMIKNNLQGSLRGSYKTAPQPMGLNCRIMTWDLHAVPKA
jgi:hypothetical protein